jgi:non-homologous end joining protein Ku
VLAPAQQVSIRKGSDEVLPEKSIVKGYEYEKDRYVVVEHEELIMWFQRTQGKKLMHCSIGHCR